MRFDTAPEMLLPYVCVSQVAADIRFVCVRVYVCAIARAIVTI